MIRRTLIVCAMVLATAFACAVDPENANQPQTDEIIQLATGDGSGRSLSVRIMRPPGEGPFPLAIVNHGSPPNPADRVSMEVPSYPILSKWLVERGYVVALPLRRGYGAVGGDWNESFGKCEDPDFVGAGYETAHDIGLVLRDLSARSYVKKDRTIVLGQSAGGWGTLAFASENPAGVLGFVNFSGGRGGHKHGNPNENCAPARLVKAAGEFGKTARKPSLWLYTENDSFFAPPLAAAMYKAFRSSGGVAEFHALPPVKRDGHGFVSKASSMQLWQPIVGKFLDGL